MRKSYFSLILILIGISLLTIINRPVKATFGSPPSLHLSCQDLYPSEQALAQSRSYVYEPQFGGLPPYYRHFRCSTFNDANGYSGSCPSTLWNPRRDPSGYVNPNIYHQLNGNAPRTYTQTSFSEWCNGNSSSCLDLRTQDYGSGTASCQINLTCQNSCTPPQNVGGCSSQCDITPNVSNGCPQGGNQEFTYNMSPPNDTFTKIEWGDGTISTSVKGSTTHEYVNAGVYDIKVYKPTLCCVRRTNVTCNGAGSIPTASPTPTPLPGGSPGSVDGPACQTGYTCMHPCACDTSGGGSANNTIDTLCDNNTHSTSGGGATGIGGGGGTMQGSTSGSGTSTGGACAPGLICCRPLAGTNAPWYKVKDASFHKRGSISNPVPDPDDAVAFDSDDDGDCDSGNNSSLSCLDIGDSGIITSEGSINTGNAPASHREWTRGDTQLNTTFTPSTFLNYARSRKNLVTINSINEATGGTINYISGAQSIDNNGLGNDNFVVIVDGDLIITQKNTYNPSNKAVAYIVTGTLRIYSETTELNGIFIANDVEYAFDINEGSTTYNPLKINGNLISFTESNCTEKRQRTDNTNQPSCFITLDFVNQYLPLMDLLSMRYYNWNE